MEEFSDAHENKTAEEIESSLENILYCTFKSRNQYEGLSSQVSKLKSMIELIKEQCELVEQWDDLDRKEKVASNFALLEGQLAKDEKRLKELLDRINVLERAEKMDEEEDKLIERLLHANGQDKENELEGIVSNKVAIATAVPPSATLRQRGNKPGVSGNPWKVKSLPGEEDDIKKEHDELTGELVLMAQRLKQNNFALRDLIRKDKDVVSETEMALGGNAGKFEEQHRNLQKFTNQSWATTWKLIVLFATVLVSTFVTFFIIIVTRSR